MAHQAGCQEDVFSGSACMESPDLNINAPYVMFPKLAYLHLAVSECLLLHIYQLMHLTAPHRLLHTQVTGQIIFNPAACRWMQTASWQRCLPRASVNKINCCSAPCEAAALPAPERPPLPRPLHPPLPGHSRPPLLQLIHRLSPLLKTPLRLPLVVHPAGRGSMVLVILSAAWRRHRRGWRSRWRGLGCPGRGGLGTCYFLSLSVMATEHPWASLPLQLHLLQGQGQSQYHA